MMQNQPAIACDARLRKHRSVGTLPLPVGALQKSRTSKPLYWHQGRREFPPTKLEAPRSYHTRRYVGLLYFATRDAGYTPRITAHATSYLAQPAPENGAEAAAGWFDKTHTSASADVGDNS